MSRIKSKNTKPEIAVRILLHKAGYRFRLHVSSLPGKPDIVLRKYKTAIFVHGCFWHRHSECKFAYNPKTDVAKWKYKFKQNIDRHTKVEKQLIELGWKVIVIWECEVSNPDRINKILNKELRTGPL